MISYVTKYGNLEEIPIYDTYNDGNLKECILSKKIELDTPYGKLIPQYEQDGIRQKYTNSISFFKNGNISRIALSKQVEVDTLVGKLPAELITFYKNGNIKRIFPLNGKISGYWSEDDEYNLAKDISIELPFGICKTKIIGIYFYEDGQIKSLTLWSKSKNLVQTPLGLQKSRIGISFYKNGNLKSYEPAVQIDIDTPIGLITAYDVNANGITGDDNSVKFTENQKLKSLITSTKKMRIINKGIEKIYSPEYIKDVSEEDMFFKPLKIEFKNEEVIFNGRDKYIIGESNIIIEDYCTPSQSMCLDCASCNQCT